MATKVTSERALYFAEYFQQVNQGGYVKTAGPTGMLDKTLVSSFSGVQNPSWWRQVRYGQSATTIASGVRQSFAASPEFAFIAYQAGSQLVERQVVGNPTLQLQEPPPGGGNAPGLIDSVLNAVLIRFLKKCLGEQRKLQAGVFLGELRQTINLIRNPLKAFNNAIYEYVHAARGRSRYLSPRQIPRMITEEYLSFQFGVRPLLADIEGAYKLCLRLRDLPQLVRVRAFAKDEKQISCTSAPAATYDIPFWFTRTRAVRCSAKIVGAVSVRSVGPVPPLTEGLGFRLRDHVATAYNLIPYSFILDYFVNVNDIIDCLSFAQADVAWHSRSARTEGYTELVCCPARPQTVFGSPCVGYSFNPCSSIWKDVTFSRDGGSLGLPSLVVKLPSFGQGVNIAALASLRVL
jgi:hypothetical protein